MLLPDIYIEKLKKYRAVFNKLGAALESTRKHFTICESSGIADKCEYHYAYYYLPRPMFDR